MTNTTEFIQWIEQLDSDLDREFSSYNLNDNGQLVYVDLQEGQVTDTDLLPLSRMSDLEHLNLCGNEFTDDGLIHISELSKLKYLDIGFNEITDDGMKHLQQLTNLESLLLNGLDDEDQLTGEGLRRLLPLTKLKELRLNSAQITDASVAILITFQKLKHLDVSWTKISEDGINELKKGLPDCEIECNSAA